MFARGFHHAMFARDRRPWHLFAPSPHAFTCHFYDEVIPVSFTTVANPRPSVSIHELIVQLAGLNAETVVKHH